MRAAKTIPQRILQLPTMEPTSSQNLGTMGRPWDARWVQVRKGQPKQILSLYHAGFISLHLLGKDLEISSYDAVAFWCRLLQRFCMKSSEKGRPQTWNILLKPCKYCSKFTAAPSRQKSQQGRPDSKSYVFLIFQHRGISMPKLLILESSLKGGKTT